MVKPLEIVQFNKADLFVKCQLCGVDVSSGELMCKNRHVVRMSIPHEIRHKCRFCGTLIPESSVSMVGRGNFIVRYYEHAECSCGAHYNQLFGEFYKWEMPKKPELSKSMKKKMDKLRLWTEE